MRSFLSTDTPTSQIYTLSLHDAFRSHVNYLTGYNSFFTSERMFYWTAILLLLITIFCSLRLQFSRLGRAWLALRADEPAAAVQSGREIVCRLLREETNAFFGGVEERA